MPLWASAKSEAKESGSAKTAEGLPLDTPEQAEIRKELKGKGYIYMPDKNLLYRMNADGSDKKLIWKSSGSRDYIDQTKVSWDGKWLAVVAMANQNGRCDQWLWLMKHDGSESKKIIENKAGGYKTRMSCAWSPDNAWLVVAHGGKVMALNLESRKIKDVLEVEGKNVGIAHLSSDRKGSYYFWGHGMKTDSFSLDKDCKVIKALNKCGMTTACQPNVSPDGVMIARHDHDYELNNGHKRGYVSWLKGGKKEHRWLPETQYFNYRGTQNKPFWSYDGSYIGYMYQPDKKILGKAGYSIKKDSAILVVCRTKLNGGPMVWLTVSTDRMSLCTWGPVPE